jgi:long-chain-fatty-acid--CoA ligase ACSBG
MAIPWSQLQQREAIDSLAAPHAGAGTDGNCSEEHFLSREVLTTSRQIGSAARTASDIAADPLWRKYIDAGIQKANRKAASRAQCVQKWRVVPEDFSECSGELTATQKVKRGVVLGKYSDLIDAMYATEEEKEAL